MKWIRRAICVLSLLLCLVSIALWINSDRCAQVLEIKHYSWPQPDVSRSTGIQVHVIQGQWNLFYVTCDYGFFTSAGFTVAQQNQNRRELPAGLHTKCSILPSANWLVGGIVPYQHLGTPSFDFVSNEFHKASNWQTHIFDWIRFPAWLPPILFLAYPLWALQKWLRNRKRYAKGLCPQCGYDLRASPERCPECGAERKPTLIAH